MKQFQLTTTHASRSGLDRDVSASVTPQQREALSRLLLLSKNQAIEGNLSSPTIKQAGFQASNPCFADGGDTTTDTAHDAAITDVVILDWAPIDSGVTDSTIDTGTIDPGTTGDVSTNITILDWAPIDSGSNGQGNGGSGGDGGGDGEWGPS